MEKEKNVNQCGCGHDHEHTHDHHDSDQCCHEEHSHEHHHGEHHHGEHHHGEHEGCGCEHDHHECDGEDEVITITLTMDDNTNLECVLLGTFEYDNKDYMALLPESDEFQDEVFLYEYRELEDDEVELDLIDEEIFDEVAGEFDRLFNDSVEEQ